MADNKFVNFSIGLIGVVILIVILERFQSFLRPFTIALVLTFLFLPITRLSKEKKIRLVGITIVFVAALVGIIGLVGSFVIEEGAKATTLHSDSDEKLADVVAEALGLTKISFFGKEFDATKLIPAEKISQYAGATISLISQSIVTLFSQAFLVLLFLLFLLPSHNSFVNRVARDMPPTQRKKFRSALNEIEKSIRAYLATKSIISLGTAFASAIVMWLMGVHLVFVFAILIFILNFIPSIGSLIAVGLVVISQFLVVGLGPNLIILLVLLTAIQILFGNIIEPKFAGKQLELSPIVILLSLFFWGSIWGVAGMLFAVPLTAVIKIVLQRLDSTKGVVKCLS